MLKMLMLKKSMKDDSILWLLEVTFAAAMQVHVPRL